MLQRIRDKSSGPLAYVIVGLIALVFSVWGVGSYFTESADPAVAEVGGTEITKYQLQRAYDQRYQRLQRLMGENFDSDEVDPQRFRRSVLQSLIQQELLKQYAEDAGYRVSDAALLDALRSDSRFQVDGSFSAERYRSMLSQAGISPSAFEANLRERRQVAQIRRGVLNTAFVTDRSVRRAFALENQKRHVDYLSFEPDDFRDQVEISEAEIETYYRDHPDAFMQKQRVKLDYVMLNRDALEITEEPDEKLLKALYEDNKEARFKTPERRQARHILVRIDENTDADAARERIQEIANEINNSEADFAEAARRVSDDQATANKGGKLDWVSRGTMVAPFEDALFNLEKGEISSPVKTEFGWHLIKLEKIDFAEVKPFDNPEVQSELKSLYSQQAREERYQKMAERLDALSFEAPESLQPIVNELGLEIRSSDWITREGGQGIAGNKAVIKAAFSDSVLKDGLNSTPIQLSGDRQVVLRVADKKAAKRRSLESVRDEIKDRLVHEAAVRLANDRAESALKALRGGKQLAAVADNGPAKRVELGWIGRESDQLPSALRDAAFALPQPSKDAVRYGKATTADGKVAVLRVSDARTPAPEASGADQRIRRNLRGRIAGIEYAAVRQSLRDDYDVTIHEDRLK